MTTTESTTLVVRADMPDLDVGKDVVVTIEDGMLHATVEHREEQDTTEDGVQRHEVRYERFTRALPAPAGLTTDDVTTTYTDGTLEIRFAPPAHAKELPA